MNDVDKSKDQLIAELVTLRQQVAELQRAAPSTQQINGGVEQALQKDEALLRNIINNTIALVYVKQTDGRYLLINSQYENLLQMTLSQVQGKTDYDILPKEIADLFRASDLRVFETGTAIQFEQDVPFQTGACSYITVKFPLFNAAGQLYAIGGISTDITEHRRAEVERERLLVAEREQRLLAETMGEVFLALAAHTSYEAVLAEILCQVQRLVSNEMANIMLLEGQVLHFVYSQGYEAYNNQVWLAKLQQSLNEFPVDAEVVRSRRPVVIFDTHQNPDWVIVPETAWIRSFVALPICLNERVLGLLRLDGDRPGKFSNKDVERLQPLVNAAAIVLENARLYDQARQELAARKQIEFEIIQRNSELLALQYAGATIASSLDLPHILKAVTREMANLLNIEGCVIFDWNQATDTIAMMAEYRLVGQWEEERLAKIYPLTHSPLIRQVLRERRAQAVTRSQTGLAPAVRTYMQAAQLKTLLILPMEAQDHLVGLVEMMDSRIERSFKNEEIALVQLLANQAASAIENARLYAETHQRLKEQIALRQAGMVISSTLDLATVLSHITEQMGRAVDATSAYLCGYDSTAMMSTVLSEYFGPRACAQERVSDLHITYPLPRDFSSTFDRLQIGQPEIVHLDEPEMSAGRRGHMEQYGARTILNIPLQIGGRVIAFAELWESQRRREFNVEEIALCQGIAQQAAIALENARLYDQAQREIAERIQMAEELRRSEARHRALLDAIPDLMFRMTREGQYLDYHLGKKWDLNLPYNRYIGQNIGDVLPFPIASLTLDYVRKTLDSGLSQVFEYQLPLLHGTQDFETRLVVSDDEEVIGIVRNVTERKRAQEQAIRTERLAALGKLAATLTHEISNPLQAIQAHLDLLLDFPLEPGEDKQYLQIIRQEIDRLINITRHVLNFARPKPALRQRVHVTDLLQHVLVLTGKQCQYRGIQVMTDLQEVSPVLAAPDQLTQVFLNLVINAIEAAPASDGRLQIVTYAEADQVAISFINNGPVIQAETLPHIFEPFFTTKPEGSGLGLWISHLLVQQHNGLLTVENLGNDQGVIFTVNLPAVPSMELEG